MTGADHYREAERLLTEPPALLPGEPQAVASQQDQYRVARAQVHATLAQVALAFDTASPAAPAGINNDAAWYKAIQA